MTKLNHSEGYISEVIGLAWADDVSFDQIKQKLGLVEADVIKLMRGNLKPSSFRVWRARVSGRKTKHAKLLRKVHPSAAVPQPRTEEEFC